MSRSDSDRRAGLRRSNGLACCHLGLRGRIVLQIVKFESECSSRMPCSPIGRSASRHRSQTRSRQRRLVTALDSVKRERPFPPARQSRPVREPPGFPPGQLLWPTEQLAGVNAGRTRHLGGNRTRLQSCATFFRPRSPSPSFHRHVPSNIVRYTRGTTLGKVSNGEISWKAMCLPSQPANWLNKVGFRRRKQAKIWEIQSRFNVSDEVARAMLAKRRFGK
jgi:hypothetical protein